MLYAIGWTLFTRVEFRFELCFWLPGADEAIPFPFERPCSADEAADAAVAAAAAARISANDAMNYS